MANRRAVWERKKGVKNRVKEKKRVGVKTKGHSGGAVLPQVLPRRGAKDPFDALAALQQPVAGNGEVAVSPRLQLPAAPAAGAASDATADAPREWLAGRGGRAPGERAVRGELPAPLPRGTEPRQRRWRGEASVRPPARSWAARKGRPPGSSASPGGTGGGGSARARRGGARCQSKQKGWVNFKFGVLCAKDGQLTDDEMFSTGTPGKQAVIHEQPLTLESQAVLEEMLDRLSVVLSSSLKNHLLYGKSTLPCERTVVGDTWVLVFCPCSSLQIPKNPQEGRCASPTRLYLLKG
ncbi:uncharacterized protein GJ701_006291 [Geothlypis trichas]